MPPPEADENRLMSDDAGAGAEDIEIPRAVLETDDDDEVVPSDDLEAEPPPIETKARRSRRSRVEKGDD